MVETYPGRRRLAPAEPREVRVQGQVADRLIVQGTHGQGPRVGEIVEVVAGHDTPRYRVRWADGHESVFSPGPGVTVDAGPRMEAEWDARVAAVHTRCAAWRRGVTAGVGHEASVAQTKLA
jgi:hypothetical protein